MSAMPSPAAIGHPMVPAEAVIRSVTPEIDGVATYEFAFRDPERARAFAFQPGQFNMLYVPGLPEVPISLSADPRATDTWAHTIRLAGNTTRAIAALGEGGTLGLRGPYGSAWPLDACRDGNVIILAGGIGLAPLRSAIYAILAQRAAYGAVTLLYGARSPNTLLYSQEFDAWRRDGIEILTTVDRADGTWTGDVGVVPQLLERLPLRNAPQTRVLICGPEVMMRFSAAEAIRNGIPTTQIWVSLERNMQCAIGWCGHCQLGPAFICRDGPILRYDRIADFLPVEGL